MLTDIVGPKGPQYLPLVGTIGAFILLCEPDRPGPRLHGADEQHQRHARLRPHGVGLLPLSRASRSRASSPYLKHFAAPPGAPLFIAPIMLPIEIISHFSRVLSLSLRLFGNIFGEELVILILFSIVPFLVPLPMMFLGIITASLQAFIFVMLTMIYLGGAVAAEHGHEEAHGHGDGRARARRGGRSVGERRTLLRRLRS